MGAGGVHRGDLGHGLGLLALGRGHLGLFKVGRPAALARGDGVLAGVGQHHEFVAKGAADGPGVGLHHREVQAQAVEHRAVGFVHHAVAGRRTFIVGVKGVAVLHDEFARAHHPEAGADLVAELGLELVEVQRHVPVGAHFAADEVGDDLLVGGGQAIVVIVAVLEAQQLTAVVLPAARFPPQLGGLHSGHEKLPGSGRVHLLADDALHLA